MLKKSRSFLQLPHPAQCFSPSQHKHRVHVCLLVWPDLYENLIVSQREVAKQAGTWISSPLQVVCLKSRTEAAQINSLRKLMLVLLLSHPERWEWSNIYCWATTNPLQQHATNNQEEKYFFYLREINVALILAHLYPLNVFIISTKLHLCTMF